MKYFFLHLFFLAVSYSSSAQVVQIEWLAKPEYDEISIFSEGMAVVRKGNKWGFIDSTGKLVVPMEYDEYHKSFPYSEGLVCMRKGDYKTGKWGFIDKKGRVKIPFIYDEAYKFSDGLAAVRKGYFWGFIDKTGKVKIPFEYTDVSYPFSKGGGNISGKRL